MITVGADNCVKSGKKCICTKLLPNCIQSYFHSYCGVKVE